MCLIGGHPGRSPSPIGKKENMVERKEVSRGKPQNNKHTRKTTITKPNYQPSESSQIVLESSIWLTDLLYNTSDALSGRLYVVPLVLSCYRIFECPIMVTV
jgi:hypothetical protein